VTRCLFFDEEDAQEAVEEGTHVFAAALVEADLVLTRVIDVRASYVGRNRPREM